LILPAGPLAFMGQALIEEYMDYTQWAAEEIMPAVA
jgi:hypothetical protein